MNYWFMLWLVSKRCCKSEKSTKGKHSRFCSSSEAISRKRYCKMNKKKNYCYVIAMGRCKDVIHSEGRSFIRVRGPWLAVVVRYENNNNKNMSRSATCQSFVRIFTRHTDFTSGWCLVSIKVVLLDTLLVKRDMYEFLFLSKYNF